MLPPVFSLPESPAAVLCLATPKCGAGIPFNAAFARAPCRFRLRDHHGTGTFTEYLLGTFRQYTTVLLGVMMERT